MGFAFLAKVKSRIRWGFGWEKESIVTFAALNDFDEKAIVFRLLKRKKSTIKAKLIPMNHLSI